MWNLTSSGSLVLGPGTAWAGPTGGISSSSYYYYGGSGQTYYNITNSMMGGEMAPSAGVLVLDEEGILVEYEKKRLAAFVRIEANRFPRPQA